MGLFKYFYWRVCCFYVIINIVMTYLCFGFISDLLVFLLVLFSSLFFVFSAFHPFFFPFLSIMLLNFTVASLSFPFYFLLLLLFLLHLPILLLPFLFSTSLFLTLCTCQLIHVFYRTDNNKNNYNSESNNNKHHQQITAQMRQVETK